MTQDRRTSKRRWFKMYAAECINGSIRYQCTPAERGVWYDLLAFASLCTNTGDICDRDGRAFPLSFIANRLNIRQELLKRTLAICEQDERITQDDTGIHITNWTRYQSEYDRVKPYRDAARDGREGVTTKQKSDTEDDVLEGYDAPALREAMGDPPYAEDDIPGS